MFVYSTSQMQRAHEDAPSFRLDLVNHSQPLRMLLIQESQYSVILLATIGSTLEIFLSLGAKKIPGVCLRSSSSSPV